MRARRLVLSVLALVVGIPVAVAAQDRRDEQFYYPGSFNWTFLRVYPEAARLFNAFDYGHAVLYERLLTKPAAEREAALEKEYQFLTTDLLIRPPRFAVAEEVIEPTYAKLAWQAKQMFDWAHVLHRQIYDIYSDERLGSEAKDALIEKVTDYYLSRSDLAFTAVPKSMALMDEQYFSQVFRRRHEKFNGLIWSYHWLQVGLYEPLILGSTVTERKAGLKATLARFWSMLEDPPARFPRMMPMTATIAPTFSAKHPRAAVIFDNLHMMHDIISDVLASDTIPKGAKRAVIYRQLAEFRDSTRNVMSMDEWRNMGEMMGGVGAMGGPATGLLTPAMAGRATPGVDRAAMGHGASPRDSMAGKPPMAPGHAMPPAGDSAAKPMPAGHAKPDSAPPPAHAEHARTASAPPKQPAPDRMAHDMATMPGAVPLKPPADTTSGPVHADTPTDVDSGIVKSEEDSAAIASSGGLPMHAWHPFIVHLPLVALVLAAFCDLLAAWRPGPRWRDAASLLWWVGLAGLVAAVVTGLVAYNRVDHSDPAHEVLTLHRNLALVSGAVLLGTAAWRWRRPFSRAAAALGIVGVLGLAIVGYVGGEMVYRHALGIPTEVLRQVRRERVGYDEQEMKPATSSADTTADSAKALAKKPHTHASGKEHDD
jgi:uncharacterized membrane protein